MMFVSSNEAEHKPPQDKVEEEGYLITATGSHSVTQSVYLSSVKLQYKL